MGEMGLVKVDFHGQQIDCVRDERGVWVSLRRICENVGIDADSQRAKLESKGWACTAMITVQLPDDGQRRALLMLHMDSVPMWLATIDAERVAEHVRPRIELYQRECARALRDFWFKGEASRAETVRSAPALSSVNITTMRAIRWMARSFCRDYGVSDDVADAAALETIRLATGVPVEPIRKAIPGRATSPEWLNPTQIGEQLGVNAREANKRLEAAGFQLRTTAGDWQITEAGKAHGEAKPYNRNGHSGFQLQWRPGVVAALRPSAPEIGAPSALDA